MLHEATTAVGSGRVLSPVSYIPDCVYMQEHNRVMNVSNEDWIHVNRFIRSASPNGSSQDREVDTIRYDSWA